MNYKIAVVPGDGIGPEVVGQAIRVLDKVGEKYGHTFEYTLRCWQEAALSTQQENACRRKR